MFSLLAHSLLWPDLEESPPRPTCSSADWKVDLSAIPGFLGDGVTKNMQEIINSVTLPAGVHLSIWNLFG